MAAPRRFPFWPFGPAARPSGSNWSSLNPASDPALHPRLHPRLRPARPSAHPSPPGAQTHSTQHPAAFQSPSATFPSPPPKGLVPTPSCRYASRPQRGDVAQSVRVPACHAGGCGFESRRPRHLFGLLERLADGRPARGIEDPSLVWRISCLVEEPIPAPFAARGFIGGWFRVAASAPGRSRSSLRGGHRTQSQPPGWHSMRAIGGADTTLSVPMELSPAASMAIVR